MSRPAVRVAYLWLLLSGGGPVLACGLIATLETPSGSSIPLEHGTTTTLTTWALNTLVLTLPAGECMVFTIGVTVDGRAWDNKIPQKLQPMGPLVFTPDYEVFALTASAMFRVTDEADHTIEVTYRDESDEGTQTFTYRFSAARR